MPATLSRPRIKRLPLRINVRLALVGGQFGFTPATVRTSWALRGVATQSIAAVQTTPRSKASKRASPLLERLPSGLRSAPVQIVKRRLTPERRTLKISKEFDGRCPPPAPWFLRRIQQEVYNHVASHTLVRHIVSRDAFRSFKAFAAGHGCKNPALCLKIRIVRQHNRDDRRFVLVKVRQPLLAGELVVLESAAVMHLF